LIKDEIRKIIHVDMDAFYASVEQMDDETLKGKPIAVGGSKERGVVAAASYEARKFGVKSAMSSKMAAIKCPELIFVKPRFKRYKEISTQIQNIFLDYTHLVEPLSLDEAYLDVTRNKKGIPYATDIAIEIKKRIKTEVGLTASAGVSINKFLAKVASDYKKPDGLFVIKPHQVEKFVEQLGIEKFFGVGKVTREKMNQLGIFKGKDLKKFSKVELKHYFGKSGEYFFNIAYGLDTREVNPNRIRKSIGAENTFSEDLKTKKEVRTFLKPIVEECWRRAENANITAATACIKIKYEDFTQITRSKTIPTAIETFDELENIVSNIIEEIELEKNVRLLGCSLSNFVNQRTEAKQLTLYL
jgi:DNA polymerase IV